ncbi:MAG: alkaline phosphatase family protein [Chloroflexi bacterium]|nr:MAG: alkaline phosphatase family protein [Chloroflexota bacterium]TME48423.1 MAG: alkaline phosphatase family protein [Chloroflexota bacterium]
MRTRVHLHLPIVGLAAIALLSGGTVGATGGEPPGRDTGAVTPIQHLVVIFQENVSFDHYFATYPVAANPAGEPSFAAAADTPSVNGLNTPLNAPNNPNSTQPFRLGRSQYETCDQNHGYRNEQQAFDHGLMDLFPETTGVGNPPPFGGPCVDYGHGTGLAMGYYDGNTVTALWNYAQTFAMSDNAFDTNFGPSTVGALNLASGQTHGFLPDPTFDAVTPNDTVIGDPQPAGDICDTRDTTTSTDPNNKNIGDLLNAKNVTWGWFQGGFREAPGAATCTVTHTNMAGVVSKDYIPHHEPFQYYTSTANPQHLPPSSPDKIGKSDQANHQYDMNDFWTAVDDHRMPAVGFLKAPAYQDGHAGYSDPLDEQHFLVDTINRLERTPYWNSTAVVIAYDDSDGWYDHAMSPIVNQSQDGTVDALAGANCGAKANNTMGGYQDRCGYGPRLPLLVISRFAKSNFVDHSVTDQTSILRFIEDNWQTSRIGNFSFDTKAGSVMNMLTFTRNGPEGGPNKLFLDPSTGEKTGDRG